MTRQSISVAFSANITQFQQAMSRVSRSVQDTARGVSDKAKAMGDAFTPASAGIVAFAGAGILASSQLSDGITVFKTKLGATGTELKGYEGNMKTIAKSGVGSFEEIGNAIVGTTQNMKGLKSNELEKLTTQGMHLAKVMDVDVGEVTRSAGLMMENFGLTGQESMDMIAKAQQLGLNGSGEMLDTINEYSVQFKDMGFTGKDMFNVLASGMDNGVFSIDKMADGIKEFNIRAGDGSKSTSEAFSGLGLDAVAMGDAFNQGGEASQQAFMTTLGELSKIKDETERNNIAVALFGTTYEDLQTGLVSASKTGEDAMGNFGGTAEQVARDNAGFSEQIKGAWNSISLAIAPVGDKLKAIISTALPYIISGVEQMSTAFQNLSPKMQTVVLALGGVVAVLPMLLAGFAGVLSAIAFMAPALPLLVTGFKFLASGVGTMINVFMNVGKAFMWLSRLFLANPFLLIIAGIVIVGILIYKHWDTIKVWLANAWTSIKSGISTAWNGITNFFRKWGTTILAVITGPIGLLTLAIYRNWDSIKSKTSSIWNGIKSYMSGLWNSIKSNASSVWNNIKTSISNAVTGMKSKVTSVLNNIKSFMSGLWNGVKSNASSAWNSIKSKISGIVDGVKSKITGTWNGLKSATSSAFNNIKSSMTRPIESAKNTISGMINKIKGFFSGLRLKIPTPSMPRMPSFSLKTSSKTVFGKEISYPSGLNVSWHQNGGIIKGTNGGTIVGMGENGGDEAILPLSNKSRMKPFAQAVARMMPERQEGSQSGFSGEITLNVPVYMDGREIAKGTAKFTQYELEKLANKQKRLNGQT